ncbi:MAG: hypothetical protein LV481_15555 [Methylacidiphilales bacterium]|nr:hypothetical protein [Candidatus Methylacidiphilales bacterium]
MNKPRFAVLIGMILVAAALRLVPHPPNFAPLTAMALFGGACFTDKRLAFLVPLIALFLSDLVIGFYALMPVVYGSFVLTVCLGFWLRHQRNASRVIGASIVSAIMFFILTNLGVWAFETLYPKTTGGLVDCFVMAIPFFGNTLVSSLLYSAMLFGGLAFAESRFNGLREYRLIPSAA